MRRSSHATPRYRFCRLELDQHASGWREYRQSVLRIADDVRTFAIFLGRYVSQYVSPKRAVELLEAKREIQSVSGDLEALKQGTEAIQISVQSFLPGIMSVTCTRWRDYLSEISRLTSSARALAECAGKYGGSDISVMDIRTLHESKNALTTSLEKLAVLRDDEGVTDWPSYVAMVKRRVRAGAELIHSPQAVGQARCKCQDSHGRIGCKKTSKRPHFRNYK